MLLLLGLLDTSVRGPIHLAALSRQSYWPVGLLQACASRVGQCSRESALSNRGHPHSCTASVGKAWLLLKPGVLSAPQAGPDSIVKAADCKGLTQFQAAASHGRRHQPLAFRPLAEEAAEGLPNHVCSPGLCHCSPDSCQRLLCCCALILHQQQAYKGITAIPP